MTYELNIEIVIVESVWDLPLHGESLNFSTSFYMLDQPLLDVNVRGFGEKMLGSPCRPLSSIFENVTQTTSLQSTLFFRYVTDFSPGGGGVLPIMAYTGRLRPKGVLVHGPEQISVPFKGTNCEWYQIKVHLKEFQN